MCGIAGFVVPHDHEMPMGAQLMHALLLKNADRGNRGHGVLTVASGGFHFIYKNLNPVEDTPASEYDLLLRSNIQLGHVLAPTNGDDVTIQRCHPFEGERLILAHNGVLHNWEGSDGWQIPGLPVVDSVRILGGIEWFMNEGQSIPEAIRTVASLIEGQYACWVYDKHTRDVFLFRCMSTIYFSQTKYVYTFSSKDEDPHTALIPEGVVMRVRSLQSTVAVDNVGAFSYLSPYRAAQERMLT